MPVDREVVRYRAGEARSAIRELLRLVSKPYEKLNIDEKYSMRLVEALVSLCIHIAVEEYGKPPHPIGRRSELWLKSWHPDAPGSWRRWLA